MTEGVGLMDSGELKKRLEETFPAVVRETVVAMGDGDVYLASFHPDVRDFMQRAARLYTSVAGFERLASDAASARGFSPENLLSGGLFFQAYEEDGKIVVERNPDTPASCRDIEEYLPEFQAEL